MCDLLLAHTPTHPPPPSPPPRALTLPEKPQLGLHPGRGGGRQASELRAQAGRLRKVHSRESEVLAQICVLQPDPKVEMTDPGISLNPVEHPLLPFPSPPLHPPPTHTHTYAGLHGKPGAGTAASLSW